MNRRNARTVSGLTRDEIRAVTCPWCDAHPEEPCRRTHEWQASHLERVIAAADARLTSQNPDTPEE